MSMLIPQSAPVMVPTPLPAPRVALSIGPATMDDLPFMDGLQKLHAKQLGYWSTDARRS